MQEYNCKMKQNKFKALSHGKKPFFIGGHLVSMCLLKFHVILVSVVDNLLLIKTALLISTR